ncbi:uncharacterized protein LOC116188774 [Punica granatum]|uniref:Uncharacterized protein LOC116188774 n=1 Tax=Punica granatum TaxID=22663 RepID=A0A6P8BTB5_PUNGR|nr:uncharacterized protein LOC116188774 [Punica granatum]
MADNSSPSTLTVLPSSSSNSTTLPSSFPTIPVKLNGRNYLYWKGVMTHLLTTNGLLNYVEGKVTVPSKTKTAADGTIMLNSDFLNWQSRDNFALTCIMLVVTEEIGVTLLSAKTSHEAWTSLATAFLTQTAAQENLLDQQWRDLKKGDQSMAKFIGAGKEHVLRYSQIGKPKSVAEINRRIYTGLGPDWEPIVLAQSERMIAMSTKELQSLLVGHEERRLYAAVQNAASVTASSAPLSGILGAPPIEVNYVDGRHNQSGRNKGKIKGGKGNGK